MAEHYTDADVELVAERLYRAWHYGVPFADQAADVRAEYLEAARAVLHALFADGWRPLRRVAGYVVENIMGLIPPEDVTIVYREFDRAPSEDL
jgi:hypothetical protein